MIKRSVLHILTNRKIRKIQKGDLKGYVQSKDIGILLNTNDDQSEVDDIAQMLRKEGKSTTILNVDSSGIKQGRNDFPSIGAKDVGPMGGFRSQHLIHFVSKHYDYLFVLDHKMDYLIQYIAVCCDARCRIGFADQDNPFLDMQIKPDKNRELEDVFRYARMIDNE